MAFDESLAAPFRDIPYNHCPSPCTVIHLGQLEKNARLLASVRKKAGCKVLLAQKGYAAFATYPLLSKYLSGTCGSGIYEALLGKECFGGEVHVYSPAYHQSEMEALVRFASHLSFNSLNQWRSYRGLVAASGRSIQCGLRVNPGYSEVEVELYNPCAAGSRLGIIASELAKASDADWKGISGLHFHSLCEQNSDTLERTLAAFEKNLGSYLSRLKWVNFGGGHHITRPDYDVDRLIRLIKDFKSRYDVEVILEPGEAIGLNTGVLVATVMDIVRNDKAIAILDTSATAHMPDTLEMPYRAEIMDAGLPNERKHTYRLGGLTCLAGDVMGDYSFDEPLQIGQRLVFMDMAHYTMVKSSTFNGVPLPAIALYDPQKDALEVVRKFGYDDYKSRLS